MEKVKNRPVTGAEMKYNGIPEPVSKRSTGLKNVKKLWR